MATGATCTYQTSLDGQLTASSQAPSWITGQEGKGIREEEEKGRRIGEKEKDGEAKEERWKTKGKGMPRA